MAGSNGMAVRFGIRFAICLFLMFAISRGASAQAQNIYIAQSAAGAANGADCAGAHPISFFNSSGNWGTGAAQIGPGTIVHVCGTIISQLTVNGNGSSGKVIEILFETGAGIHITPGAVNTGAINLGAHSFILIDGGTGQPCGGN